MGYRYLRTFTLESPMTFADALQGLKDGKFVGIRPQQNTNFVSLYIPKWQRNLRDDAEPNFLCWHTDQSEDPDTSIRADQFLGEWFGVVLDCSTLERNAAGMPKLRFPTDLDGNE